MSILLSQFLNLSKKIFPVMLAVTMGLSIALPSFAQTPVSAGSVSAVDMPDGRAEHITLTIQQGRFDSYSTGELSAQLSGIDFREGLLSGLVFNIRNGLFDNVPVDAVRLNASNLQCNMFELLNHRRLIMPTPAQGTAYLRITEANLNDFISSPKTIDKLESSIAKKTGGIKLISFTKPQVMLQGANQIKMIIGVIVGNSVAAPFELNGNLGVSEGALKIQDMTVLSGNAPLPMDLAKVLQDQLNKLIDVRRIAQKYVDVNVQTMAMKGKVIELNGTAGLKRLEFGL